MERRKLQGYWRRNWKYILFIITFYFVMRWITKDEIFAVLFAAYMYYMFSVEEKKVNDYYDAYKKAIWIASEVNAHGIKNIENIQKDGFIAAILSYSEEVYFNIEDDNIPYCLRETVKALFYKIRRDSTVEEVNSYFSRCIEDVLSLRDHAEFKSLNDNLSQSHINTTISHLEHIRRMLIQVIDKKITSELRFVKCQWLVEWLIEMNESHFSYPDFVRPFNLIQSTIVHLMLPENSNLYSFEERLSALSDKLEEFVSAEVYDAESNVEMYLVK